MNDIHMIREQDDGQRIYMHNNLLIERFKRNNNNNKLKMVYGTFRPHFFFQFIFKFKCSSAKCSMNLYRASMTFIAWIARFSFIFAYF